jgi:hypothetical protein
MNEDLLRALASKKLLDDQVALSQIQQLAFDSPSTHSIMSATTAATSATTLATAQHYATGTIYQYFKKNEEDRKLFMNFDSLKIIAFNVDARCDDNSVYEFEDTSAISSNYAITEYFNVMYYDKLLIPGFKQVQSTKTLLITVCRIFWSICFLKDQRNTSRVSLKKS